MGDKRGANVDRDDDPSRLQRPLEGSHGYLFWGDKL